MKSRQQFSGGSLKIAWLVSRIFDPLVWLLPLSLIIFYSSALDGYHRFFWAVILLFFLFFLPLVSFVIMYRRGIITSIELLDRRERSPFILFNLFFWSLGLLIVWWLSGPVYLVSLLLSAIIVGFLLLVINFYSKFSGHAMITTIAAFLINSLHDWRYWWFFLFIPLVSWSRYVQRCHTVIQLVGGTLLGCLFYLLLNLIY